MTRLALVLLVVIALFGCAPERQTGRCGGISTLVVGTEVRTNGTFLSALPHGMIFTPDKCNYSLIPEFASLQAYREARKMRGGYYRAEVVGTVKRRLGRTLADIQIVSVKGLHEIRRPLPPTRLIARGRGNHALFFLAPGSARISNCVTHINLWVEDGRPAKPLSTDETWRVEAGLFWVVRSKAGQCIGRLPLRYGVEQGGETVVSAKSLRAGDIYRIHVSLEPDQLAGTLFRILPDGRVENVADGLVKSR